MAFSEGRSDISNDGFLVSGHFFTRYPEIIEQDAGRTAVLAQYTVMGKKALAVPAAGVADVGNTGDGTVTLVAKDPYSSPQVGAYNLECIAAVANGGTFKLEDPNGNLVTNSLVMTAGAGAATEFTAGGLVFTITDGAADFIVGDKFSITVTAIGKYVPLDPVATDGSEAFAGIYPDDEIAAATLVAGDVNATIWTHANGAVVSEDKLVFENSVTLDMILPSGKTLREEMASFDISVAPRLDVDEFENT